MQTTYRLSQIQYFLRQWKMLEANRNQLMPNEIKRAKLLFNSLSQLEKEELKLLKEKYYDTNNLANFDKNRKCYTTAIPVNDEVVAYKLNVESFDYSNERRQVERKLGEIMIETGQKILKTEERIYLAINPMLHVKHVDFPCDDSDFITGDIVLTTSFLNDEKQVFNMTDPLTVKLVTRLERCGFKRVAIN
ncbi:hypothetical protein [Vagococcus humatus]|uniref:Uncharacterized protein n=1 Tax=Vagococcus humatus TaxID=1889241 RepID=A0A3R9ZVJ3_9ENTE|nr:hypothetical protein [Vagococcus humatus]RST88730.1 hypothetical protein C7P63_09010 [Vagococcus humatus]